MDHTLTLLADYACNTGEGPLYHATEDAIYWTDIPAGRIFRLDRQSGEHHPIEIGRMVGGMTCQADGALLLFCDKGSVLRRSPDGVITTIVESIPDEESTRFNDVIADPAGRVFCGTMPTKERPGRLYRLDRDGSLSQVVDGVGCSNGMGFTPDRTQMYYTDTSARTIDRFDYEVATGAITNRTPFVRTEDGSGGPDGMTVDRDGFVWSTRWGGSCIVRYNPDGDEVARIAFPVQKVSSAVFGGPGGAVLYVTTAGGQQKQTDGALAGALFDLDVTGIAGPEEFVSRIGL